MKKICLVVFSVVFLVAFSFSNVMAERVSKSFNVNGAQTLLLQNLFANVTVKVGSGNSVAIMVSGDKKIVKDIVVKQDDLRLISIRGKECNGTVIINGNSIYSSGSMSNVVISGGDVIVNGKRITSGEKSEMASIEIAVPKGTNIEAFRVRKLTATGINGKLNANISGDGNLVVSDVVGMKVKCSGASECKVSRVSGDVRADASGSSNISLHGSNIIDVEADASGASKIKIVGNCRSFEADASGASEIILRGRAFGRVNKNTSGSSEIVVRQ